MFQIPTGDNTGEQRTTPVGSTLGREVELPAMMGPARQASAPTADSARAEAEAIAGGPDQLDHLLRSAKQHSSGDEIDQLNARLADPAQAGDAVKTLLAKAAGSGGQPSTLAEFNRLARKARAGDANAKALVNASDPSQFH